MAEAGGREMRRWFGLVFVIAATVFTVAVYGDLPERMPTHWNIRGEVDGWSSRAHGAFLLPALGVAQPSEP